ncbi:MAG: FGGY family carbohydrate kinase [Anaerolineales bacterium]|nr:FGGY family carbohydrate kinase [Anaerolineales bacterium]
MPLPSLVIGLDLGTTLCKACAYDRIGKALAREDRTITTYRPQPGWNEQDPLEWREAVFQVLKGVAEQLGPRSKEVGAISVSAHGPSLVLTDSNLHPLMRAPIWQDLRSSAQARYLINHVDAGWIGLGTPETGLPAKLAWAKENQPDLVDSAMYVLGTKAYLIGILTGRIVDEPSSCSHQGAWSWPVFDYLGVGEGRLAEIAPSDSIAGVLRPALSRSFSLPLDTQVILGLNDGAAACLGAGLLHPGQGIVSLSTNAVARSVVSAPLPTSTLLDRSLFSYPYIQGKSIAGGFTKAGGDSARWFSEVLHGRSVSTEEIQQEFGNIVSPAGARGVLFLPFLAGRGTPNSNEDMRGAFIGLSRHHTQQDLARAIFEGVAFTLKDIHQVFDTLGLEWSDVRLTGGGGNNLLWRQILADVLNRTLIRMEADSLLGTAIVGFVTLGLHSNYEDAIATMVIPGERITPNADNAELYTRLYARFQKTLATLEILSMEGT